MPATCGYDSNGTPRMAASGYNCRTDTQNGLWGFCPTTVSYAHDCGLGGFCIDDYACVNGCGPLPGVPGVTTWTCTTSQYCSELISDNFGNKFTNIGCGPVPGPETIYARPPAVSATTTSSSSTSSELPSTTSSSSSQSASSTDSTSQTTSPSTSTPPTSLMTAASTNNASPLPIESPSTAAPTEAAADKSSTPPLGPIIGGSVSGLAIVCLTILAIFFLRHRRRASSPKLLSSNPSDVNAPLRRSSSCLKHPERTNGYGLVELDHEQRQVCEAGEANRDPAELPAYDSRKDMSAV